MRYEEIMLISLLSCTLLQCTAQKLKVDKKMEIKKALTKLEAMLLKLKRSPVQIPKQQVSDISSKRCETQPEFKNSKTITETFEGNEDFLTSCAATICLKKPFRTRLPLEINTNSDNMFYACPSDFLFFINNQSTTFNKARLECCKRGMKLVFIEDGRKMNCLMRRHVEKFGTEERSYWTSNKNKNSLNRNPVVKCKDAYENTSYYNSVAVNIKPRKLDWENYSANANNIFYYGQSLTETFAYVCESIQRDIAIPVEGPNCESQCPSIRLCNTRSNVDYVEDAIMEPRNYFEAVQYGCGFKFVRSKIPATFTEAYQICCRLGMQILNLQTRIKSSCFAKLYTESPGLDIHIWSSASSNGCAKQWLWCSPNKTEVMVGRDNWNNNEPNNHQGDERCAIHCTRQQFKLNDIYCFEKFQFFCEEPFVGNIISEATTRM